MQCIKCKKENKKGAKFCSECGTKLSLLCSHCSAPVDADEKFCSSCGAELPVLNTSDVQSITVDSMEDDPSVEAVPTEKIKMVKAPDPVSEGERRTVTVVFADLSDYTKFSEKTDPEKVRETLNDCYKILSEIIYRQGGMVDKFIGDAVLAIFGVPYIHEDDPQRAVFSALEMRDKIEKYGNDRKLGGILRLKIGINTGMVVLGNVGGNEYKQDYTVIGDSVNLASRLENLCQTGQILVGETTFLRTKDFFEYRKHPVLEIRGKEKPVQCYEVLIVRSFASRERRKFSSRLVGREEEIILLNKYIKQSISGQTKVIGIVGEAGIGKSRLTYDLFAEYLLGEDILFLKGRAIFHGQTNPYSMFIDIIYALMGVSSTDGANTVKEKVKNRLEDMKLPTEHSCFILPLLGIEVTDDFYRMLSTEERKNRTFELIKNCLVAQSQQKPILIICEDLQWTDRTSYELLSYLIENINNTPIALFCIYRPDFKHDWTSKNNYSQIMLKELLPDEIDEMISSILDTKEIPEKLKELLLKKAEGNPFYVEELIQTLIRTGVLERKDKKWVINEKLEEIKLPDTIEGIIMSRFDTLPEKPKKLLQYASVIGRIFRHFLLSQLCSQDDIENQLNYLLKNEMIFLKATVPEKEYIFRHILIQETIYQNLLISKRKELHNEIARIIEEHHSADITEYLEVLAYHYKMAENYEKAISYFIKAGDKSLLYFSSEAIVSYFSQAVELCGKIQNPDLYISALTKLAGAYFHMGKLNKSLELYEQSLQIAKENEFLERQSYILFSMGRIYRREGNLDKAWDSQSKSLDIGRKCGYIKGQIRPLHRLATICIDRGRIEEAKKYLLEAEKLCQNVDDKLSMIYILGALGQIEQIHGNYNEAEKYYLNALDYCRQQKLKQAEVFPLKSLGRIYFQQGNFEKAIQFLEEALKLAQSLGLTAPMAWINNDLGSVYLHLGELQKAINYQADALANARRMGYRVLEANCLNDLAIIYRRLGDYKLVLEYRQEALKIAQQIGDKNLLGRLYYEIALVYRDTGNIEQAEESLEKASEYIKEIKNLELEARILMSSGILDHRAGKYKTSMEKLEKSLEIRRSLGDKPGEAYTLSALADFWADIGDFEKVIECTEKVISISEGKGYRDLMPWALLCVARTKGVKGNWDEAISYVEKGLNLSKRIGYIRFEAFAYTDLGFCYMRKKENEKAINFYQKALEICEKTGEKYDVVIRAVATLAGIYLEMKNLEKSEEHYKRAMLLAEKWKQRRYLWRLHRGLAIICSQRGNLEEAKIQYEKAIASQKEMTDNMDEEIKKIYLSYFDRGKLIQEYNDLQRK